jgi:CRP-like cAMP-binding protein
MNQAFDRLKKYIAPFGLKDADFEELIQYCAIEQFQKGDVVMKAGEKQNCIYFINQGIIKNYVNKMDGGTSIYGFRMENMLITGYALYNYKNEYRAKLNIKCLEDCELISIPLQALKFMEEHSKSAHKVGRFLAEAHALELVDYIVDIDTKSLADRYDDLEKVFPNIHQRVPQHMIASYLGITPVHLSNVKKSRKNASFNRSKNE